jgi:hypothetical protein
VTIVFTDFAASINPVYNILYCATANSSCANEAINDPSLVTLRDPKTGKLTRRIKHFSGYNVAAGEEGTGEIESSLNVMPLSAASLSARAQSISTLDLSLQTLADVRAAHPELSEEEARDLLARINTGLGLSGYILASGQYEM